MDDYHSHSFPLVQPILFLEFKPLEKPVVAPVKPVKKKPVPPKKLNRNKLTYRLWSESPYCTYCRQRLSEEEATTDHIHPKSKGGRRSPENVVLACRECNVLKGDKTKDHLEKLIRILQIVNAHNNTKKSIVVRCEVELL